MKFKVLFLIFVCFSLSGCEKWERDRIIEDTKNLGYESQKCYVEKIFPSDCDFLKEQEEDLKLRINIFLSENQIDEEQFKRITKNAYELGKLKVQGSSSDNVYNRVYRAFAKTPKYFDIKFRDMNGIDLPDINYGIFSSTCSKYSDKIFYQRFVSIPLNPPYVTDFKVIFYKLEGSCFKVEQLDEEFIIFSEEQLKHYSRVSGIQLLKFNSYDEADASISD